MPEATVSELELLILRVMLFGWEARPDYSPDEFEVNMPFFELSNHNWSNEEHRVVFLCLRKSIGFIGKGLRREMAAEATRRGHPDVDWDLYFQRPDKSIDPRRLLLDLQSAMRK